MRTSCKRLLATTVAFVIGVAAVTALVRAWRRERDRAADAPFARSEDDRTIADRIRSILGPLEAELDIPHVHVIVERGVALLHGDVTTELANRRLVEKVRQVRGVRDVVSHLHEGLLTGDTRPSAGHVDRSHAAHQLIDAAVHNGGGEITGEIAVRAVLASFAAALPPHTRRRLIAHVPLDVAAWLEPGIGAVSWHTVDELYTEIAARGAFAPAHTPWVVAAVLRQLHLLVPDDADDIAFELPPPLRHLWLDAAPTTPAT